MTRCAYRLTSWATFMHIPRITSPELPDPTLTDLSCTPHARLLVYCVLYIIQIPPTSEMEPMRPAQP
ncbi:hypothetical protein VTJ04DRAFT_2090 [Mycothermus thermophilus]|uniref:uncharacterized protein n=1 Tax=Humicola insolens TaxID=85995 RepID=UPI003744571E